MSRTLQYIAGAAGVVVGAAVAGLGSGVGYAYGNHLFATGKLPLPGAPPQRGLRGVYDPAILKAIFLAGGPGSGKSHVAREVFGLSSASFAPSGLKYVNSDPAFEMLMRAQGLRPEDLATMSPYQYAMVTEHPLGPRARGKSITEKRTAAWINEHLGIIIDGTGKNFDKIREARSRLESIGYDTAMIYVNTSLDVAMDRNRRRSRRLPDPQVRRQWEAVQRNMGRFQQVFGRRRFYLVDNSRPGPVDSAILRSVNRFMQSPVRNPIGKMWIQAELAQREKG